MIVGFKHKGLKRLFEHDHASGVRADQLQKVPLILQQLDQSRTIEDMRMTSFHLHSLKGDMQSFWSVTVSANWRIIFRLVNGDADDVELIDYH